MDAFARKQRTPIEWAQKGVRKEDYVRGYLHRMERQNHFGVYFILKSMEVGPSFRSTVPRYPVEDPNYRIIAQQRCRYTHYYFYIRDELPGALSLCVGSFLPFPITYYLNGHPYIERELLRQKVTFRKDDNAFLAVSDAAALQSAADPLSADIIRNRLDYWTLIVGPKFSQADRAAVLKRHLFDSAGGVLPEPHLPPQLPHSQIIRALLRHRPAAPAPRQDHTDLWFSDQQKVAWPTPERAGEDGPRPSCFPGLRPQRRPADV